MNTYLAQDPDVLEKALALIPQIVLIIDRSGRIVYINRVEPGYDRDQVIGTYSDEFLAPESQLLHRSELARVWETRETREFDVAVTAPDGTNQWYRSVAKPLIRNDRVESAVLVSTNVTELLAAQAEAERLRGLLPICAWCGLIRDERGRWEKLDTYISRELERGITHSMCPSCLENKLAEIQQDK